MRKKALVLGAVLALSAMTFVGCGSNDMNNSTTDQESASPAADNGTNDQPQASDNGSITDDLEDGADDVIDGAGDALEDAGDAAGDAIDDLDGDTTDNRNDSTDTNNNGTGNKKR